MKKIVTFSILITMQAFFQLVFGMHKQPSLGPSTLRLVGSLGLSIAKNYISYNVAKQAISGLGAAQNLLYEKFPVTGYFAPTIITTASYGLQKLAEYKSRLAQIRTGKPSAIWSYAGSCTPATHSQKQTHTN